MEFIDVFNGDADGICALQQLRLAMPRKADLITGVKRDIALLKKIPSGSNKAITVLDVSLDSNREPLLRLLNDGAQISYFDHHYAGELPEHSGLTAHINTAADTCTSLIVNEYLNSAHIAWAIVGAFGDSFPESAARLAAKTHYSESELRTLEHLGICLNYNGYGATVTDLHFPPQTLFSVLHPYRDPLDFIAQDPAYRKLSEGYQKDMALAADLRPEITSANTALFILPDAPWARRVSGVLANDLAQAHPTRAHALLTQLPTGNFLVSVRAPVENQDGADALCRQFPTGGGRRAAAGINDLPRDMYAEFVAKFQRTYDAHKL